MTRYLGLDVHATSCTLAVMSETGRKLLHEVVETNATALIDAIKRVPGPRHLLMEEGTQSAWLYEALKPHLAELVVMGVGVETRRARGNKSDAEDAFGLAERMRTGSYEKSVYKQVGAFGPLRSASKVYGYLTVDVARAKNRVKAMFRAWGVGTPGDDVYDEEQWDQWSQRLPPHARGPGKHLVEEVTKLAELKLEAQREMIALANEHPIYRVLQTCPGMGPVRVAQVMPIVVDPRRFRTRRQFWSYCGLGIRMQSSSDWVKQDGRWARTNLDRTRGLSIEHNRTMKVIFKSAATTIIGSVSDEDPMSIHYAKMVDGNIKPNLAKLTIARQVASVFLKMWKTGEKYDPAKLKPTTSL